MFGSFLLSSVLVVLKNLGYNGYVLLSFYFTFDWFFDCYNRTLWIQSLFFSSNWFQCFWISILMIVFWVCKSCIQWRKRMANLLCRQFNWSLSMFLLFVVHISICSSISLVQTQKYLKGSGVFSNGSSYIIVNFFVHPQPKL